jgi:hypothetical protein
MRQIMSKQATLMFAAFAVAAVSAPSAGHADPYKWCAVYGGGLAAPKNCGFVTLAQCRATISGVGGFCEPNPFYTPPARKQRRTNNS